MEEDNLPIAEVGEWALEKHERLRKYVDITRQTRRKYINPPPPITIAGGATYIDLFCGPGRARIRETGQIVDGSPLVAYRAAVEGNVRFSEIHIADVDGNNVEAAATRIAKLGGNAFSYTGRSETTAKDVVAKLNPNGLHFVFLDPYNLESLTFDTIKELSKLRHVDLMVHVSVQDLQRNIDRYASADSSPLDAFSPGWRTAVDLNQSINSVRAAIMAYWQFQTQKLGFAGSRAELVTGSNNQRLYWLMFLSRHELGNDFWNKIRHISGQRDLGF